jgi:hypothetical protein
MRRRSVTATCLSLGLVALLLPGFGASAGAAAPAGGARRDLRHVGPDYNKGRPLPLRSDARAVASTARAQLRTTAAQTAPPEVGDVRTWLALDDEQGIIYLKSYRLRGMGDNIEVWTAAGKDEVSTRLQFQEGDCRNGARTRISDDQVNYLIDEFDSNIYPKESTTFSVPPDRDGSNAILPGLVDLPADYYQGEGDNTVVLIDNVRDDNFYDLDNTQNNTYIAGFFFSVFNELHDRNVMTIDGFDWLHRTGATPPNDPAPGDNCANAPARPFLYEGTFAHEYQHLLEYYEDVDESIWINEGLSDWAQTLTGYVDPTVPIDDIDFDSHIQCFLGYLGIQTPANPIPRDGGPENSLTAWQDQGADEILCDYGAAYTIMEYLRDRFGEDFMTRLHRGDVNGLQSLQNNLDKEAGGESAADVLHKWAAMVALDQVIDGGATLTGGEAAQYTTGTLDASINWDTAETYSRPGAPPNGSDYVRLRSDDAPTYLAAGDITEITFNGASELVPLPVKWRVDRDPPQHKTSALFSGSGPNFDRTIVQRVFVRRANPTLTFETKWNTEEGWDFGYVQVSTDGGETYRSLRNRDTTRVHDPGTIQAVKDNLPGFTGNSGGWRTERFDLSAYAGRSILLSFRYITDSGVDLPGWWVDNVKIGRRSLSRGRSVAEWSSASQIRPKPVSGFTVQLVAYDDAGNNAWLGEIPLDENFDGELSGADVTDAIGNSAETVAAIVTYDEPTELVSPPQYARYELKVNGELQPGG